MVNFDAVKDFIAFVTYEDNDLPYGGLVDDAPKEAVDAYDKYRRMLEEAEDNNLTV